MRLICVDCFDLDITQTNESGNILYECGTSFYIGNEQFNWIVNTALNFDDKVEKDWGVIIFMHAFNLTAKNGTSVTPAFSSVYPKFKEMLYAFNAQSIYKEDYCFPDNQFYNLSINSDWTRYRTIEKRPYLICLLFGHIHTDDYHNYNGINHIITANQFCGEEYCDIRLNRVVGTSTQNLFDIINIDLIQRRIRVIRYGLA